jgi:uncharacterized damage-inducible protein DinB
LAGLLLPLAVAATLAAPTRRVLAQDALDAKSAAHLRDQYMADLDTVHAKIMALANAIPAEKYSWRPAAGVRSISEVLMHVAGEWYYYVPSSVGGKAPADFGVPKDAQARLEKITTKKDVIDQITKSWAYTKAQVQAVDPSKLTGKYKPWGITLDEAAFAMSGDMHEHLGQLIAYARTNGVKPPWTK